jgi:MFS family permease
LNLGHLLDHLVMLVFPTVVLTLGREWDRPYSELLPLALGGFIAFGAFAIPAGWLADHWSRYKMMAVFFFGIGGALFLTGFASSSWQIAAGLTLTGMFAAIYHPVGIAMLVAAPKNLGMALGWNGLWGNLGLAFAAIVSGALMDLWGWRTAFFVPGLAACWCPISARWRRNPRPSACTSTRARWRRSSSSCSSPPPAAV